MYAKTELHEEVEEIIEGSDGRMPSAWIAPALSLRHPMPEDRETRATNSYFESPRRAMLSSPAR